MHTIGVAIAIPEPYGSELRQYRASFGDPAAEGVPTHLTLLPPMEVETESLDEIEAHLAKVAARYPAFRIHLRGTATFRPVSPVVFMAVTEGISACEVLADHIRSGRLHQELSFPYHPHVTVAHHLDDSALDKAFETLSDYECTFLVERFHLYVHDGDEVWRAHRAFELLADRTATE
ncbi:MAG: 2'-5' RNA ligase family protein [Nocardioidaceae bacterium]